MSTREANWFGHSIEFDYAASVAGYTTVLVRLLTGWWFFHAGYTKILGPEAFDASGWMLHATQASPTASSRGPVGRRGSLSSRTS